MSKNKTHKPEIQVEAINDDGRTLQVVVINRGSGTAAGAFWVDLYIDPNTVPTAVNQTWPMLAGQGLVWGVVEPALPLDPGETVILTPGDAYFWPDLSLINEPLAAGTSIYVQVDSANMETGYGGVLEIHEQNNSPYNNIRGAITPLVRMSPWTATEPAQGSADENLLPHRSAQGQESTIWLPNVHKENEQVETFKRKWNVYLLEP